MDLIDKLLEPECWYEYLAYKQTASHLTKTEKKDLLAYIENREYADAVARIRNGIPFPLAEKKLIKKTGSDKKRTVYTFPRQENQLLKHLTYLLLRKYDCVFSDNLYSFRTGHGVGRALDRILSCPDIDCMYTYKADISDYFNSIDVGIMLDILKRVLRDDEEVYRLFEGILRETHVLDRGDVTEERKGAMAGAPFAVFLADLYLDELDRAFEGTDMIYARYSDDVILLADSEEKLLLGRKKIGEILDRYRLTVNADKEKNTAPGEKWTFLGVSYCGGTIDIAPVSAGKMKDRIRRKARALRRWMARKGASPEQAARAFIRAMNRKFFSPDSSHELTWCRWYFPLITTPDTLQMLDSYMQQWVRYVLTGKHNRKNLSVKYEQLKELGYVSLVHCWYEYRKSGRMPDLRAE